MTRGTSPIAAGPGGELFEAKVGAFYLLALLLDGEPRGLPGAHIQRVNLQAANDGHPLDDVVLHAQDYAGGTARLEIQAKHKITFSPSDQVFKAVAEQIAEVVKSGRLNDPGLRGLGIATAQGSRQIDGPYQEVLYWARNSASADAFFRRLSRPGAANEGMRTFVTTLRRHLTNAGATSDDDTVWAVLRKLQILVFDFSSEHGQTDAPRAGNYQGGRDLVFSR